MLEIKINPDELLKLSKVEFENRVMKFYSELYMPVICLCNDCKKGIICKYVHPNCVNSVPITFELCGSRNNCIDRTCQKNHII